MSASRKIIPKLKTHSKTPRHSVTHRVKADQLLAENDRLMEARDHWQKLFHLSSEKVQKLEGQLGLRDTRIAALELELAKKKAHILTLENKLFRRTSERGPANPDGSPGESPADTTTNSPGAPEAGSQPYSPPPCSPKTPRGKRPGAPGYGPKDHESVPIADEVTYDIDESCCPDCGEQWKEISTEESDAVEVEVRAYRRRHRRKKYGHNCKGRWKTKRAKGPARLFPHSKYGISVWIFLLNGKFVLQIPVNRLCIMLKQKNLIIPAGTIVAGFYRILRLLAPLIAEIKRYSREEKSHWHVDDTGWKTFVKIEGKEGFGWYLWVFRSNDVCVYIASPSRARAVPKSHLENSSGVVSCDGLKSNFKLGDNLRYALCWVHERRHLRQLLAAYPELREPCTQFLQLISAVFHYNKERLLHEDGSLQQQKAEDALSATLTQIIQKTEKCLENPQLHSELRRVLTSLKKNWAVLYTFFELPDIPPDNNPAEQALRMPAVGRKNYYGSGSKKSAELAAAMFSLSATLSLNNINLEEFLTEYMKACADNGGNPPPGAAKFLPWHRKPPPPD